MASYEIKEIKRGAGKVRYMLFGSGGGDLVIIPGLSVKSPLDSAAAIAKAYKEIAKLRRVILIDRRDEIEEGHSLADMAGDVIAAIEAEGIASADFYGVSQGGMIAQYIALERPELVRSLALISTLSRRNPESVRVITNWARLAVERESKALTADFIEKIYSEQFVRKYGRFLTMMNRGVTDEQLDRFVRLAAACADFDVYPRLGGISCPTIVMAGEKDAVTTAAAAEETAKAIGCRCVIFPGFGHAVYDEEPKVKEVLADFLSSGGR